MSSDSFTEKDKHLCFRFAYNANLTRHQALFLAQHSFPQVSFEEVDNAYNKLNSEKSKKFELNRSAEALQQLNRASLEEMPSELLEKVLEHSSNDDQKNLQKTSYGLSNYIESNFKSYETIQIHLDQETIRTNFNEQKPTVTRNIRIGEKRKLDEDRETTIQNSFHNIPDLIQHLEKVFNERNLKVQQLDIRSARGINMEERTSELFSGLQKIFEAMNNEICVGVLEVTVPNIEFLMSVLKKIKVGHLTILRIREATDIASLDCSALVNSPHWPHINFFQSAFINVNLSFDQVCHMRNAFFKNTAITVEDILKFRDRLVQHPKLTTITLSCKHLNVMNLVESLKPCLPPKDLSQKNSGAYQCANKWKLSFNVCEWVENLCFECRAIN